MTTARRLFGTDGIRGKANTEPMTAGIALRLGQAAGLMFTRGAHRHRVVIGKDTRLSGYMIEPALTAGFIGAGMDVTLLGPLPTITALFYGVFLAGVVSVGYIIWHRSLKGSLAYGPYLAAGALIVLFQLGRGQ